MSIKKRKAAGKGEGTEPLRFRVHHILCTHLYKGYGYSGPFCKNMTKLTNYYKHNQDEKLAIVTDPDEICQNCPNFNPEDNTCGGDHNHVHIKDEELATALGIEAGSLLSYRELGQITKDRLTEEFFLYSCGNCYWYKEGLCSYEELMRDLDS